MTSGPGAAAPPPAVVVLGRPSVVPPLMTALHAFGVAATWAVDVRQAAQLLDVLPGSPVVVTDDSTEQLPHAEVIDIRGVVSATDHAWATIVAPLIAALTTRAGAPAPAVDASRADLVVDDDQWCVRYRGRPLRLTDAQYRLLALLVRHGTGLVCLQELAQAMFDSSHSERQRIHSHVKRLRVRLAEETDGRFEVVAVRGLGYRLSDNGSPPGVTAGAPPAPRPRSRP